MRIYRLALWSLFIALAMRMSWSIGRFVTTDPDTLPYPQVLSYVSILPVVLTHGACGVLALFSGPFAFLLANHPTYKKSHRALGRTYMIAVLIASLTGVVMSARAYGGLISKAGFMALSLAWLFTICQAYVTIRARQIARHRAWMIRNYALTFAAVMIRQYISLLQLADYDYNMIYPLCAWLSWLPQLFAVELYLARHAIIKYSSFMQHRAKEA